MTKMIPPKGLREVAVITERGKKTYKAGKDGLINVDNPKHAAQMKHEGLGEANAMGTIRNPSSIGFTCKKCGFGSFFKKCSRCGEINE
jgi:hypothetical protein